MTTTYNWAFPTLEYKNIDELTKAVTGIHYRLSATADDGAVSQSINGTQTLDTPDPETFTDFDTLTQDQVKSWLGDELVAEKEQAADASIARNRAAAAAASGTGTPSAWSA